MACLSLPALSCFLLQVIRFCWKGKTMPSTSPILFPYHLHFFLLPGLFFLLICTPCLKLPLNNNWRQFVPVEHPQILRKSDYGSENGETKSPPSRPWGMQQSRLGCLTGWAHLSLRASFLERRSCRPVSRVRGSPTIIFFLNS